MAVAMSIIKKVCNASSKTAALNGWKVKDWICHRCPEFKIYPDPLAKGNQIIRFAAHRQLADHPWNENGGSAPSTLDASAHHGSVMIGKGKGANIAGTAEAGDPKQKSDLCNFWDGASTIIALDGTPNKGACAAEAGDPEETSDLCYFWDGGAIFPALDETPNKGACASDGAEAGEPNQSNQAQILQIKLEMKGQMDLLSEKMTQLSMQLQNIRAALSEILPVQTAETPKQVTGVFEPMYVTPSVVMTLPNSGADDVTQSSRQVVANGGLSDTEAWLMEMENPVMPIEVDGDKEPVMNAALRWLNNGLEIKKQEIEQSQTS